MVDYSDSIKVSQLLTNLSEESIANFTLDSFVDSLSHRCYGVGILVLSLPSILPISAIPGIAGLFGWLILLLSVQLILGKKKPWIPQWLKKKKMDVVLFQRFLKQSIPYVQRLEKVIKPRCNYINPTLMNGLSGVFLVVLSILLMLPIPFSNMLFGSLIAFIALGILENDQAVLLLCFLASTVTMAFFYQAIVFFVT